MSDILTPRFTLEDIKKANTYSFTPTNPNGDIYWDTFVRNLTAKIDFPDTLYSVYDLYAAGYMDLSTEAEEMTTQIFDNLNISQDMINEANMLWFNTYTEGFTPRTVYDRESKLFIIVDSDNVIQTKPYGDGYQYIMPRDLFRKIAERYILETITKEIKDIDPLISHQDAFEAADSYVACNEEFDTITYPGCNEIDPVIKAQYQSPNTKEDRLKYAINQVLKQKLRDMIPDEKDNYNSIINEYYTLIQTNN